MSNIIDIIKKNFEINFANELKQNLYKKVFQETLKKNEFLINKLKEEKKDFNFENLTVKLAERAEQYAKDFSEIQTKFGTDMANLIRDELKNSGEVEVTM